MTVSELFGNGPPTVEFRLKTTVVCAAHIDEHAANTDKKASMWCENLGVNIVGVGLETSGVLITFGGYPSYEQADQQHAIARFVILPFLLLKALS